MNHIPTAATQNPVHIQRTIYLDAEEIAIGKHAQWRRQVRRLVRLIGILCIPMVIAQTMAFGDFIYEEALQAAAFGAKACIQAEDQVVAYTAVKEFEQIMRDAQRFHDRYGCLAFWTSGSFRTYFYRSAPLQLAGFYKDGVRMGLWGEDVRRFTTVVVDGRETTLDTYRMNTMDKLKAYGFDPTLVMNSKNCLRCREEEKRTNGHIRECTHCQIAANAATDRRANAHER